MMWLLLSHRRTRWASSGFCSHPEIIHRLRLFILACCQKRCKPEGFGLPRAWEVLGEHVSSCRVFVPTIPAVFPLGLAPGATCSAHVRRTCHPACPPSCRLHPAFTPVFWKLEQNSMRCHPLLLITVLRGLMGHQGRVIAEGFEERSAVLYSCWLPGPSPRCFRPRSPTCFRAENKVAKEIKAWCGETKHEAYWLFKNILNNIL